MKTIIKYCIYLLIGTMFLGCQKNKEEIKRIHKVIDTWHRAAAEADFDTYFSKMTDDAIFIGTDPTENWNNNDFKKYAKPYFDKGKAWSFKSLERNIYTNDQIAWFDELLDTQMKICRGSGVLVKYDGLWKIKHYVLSITIPNEFTNQIIPIKKDFDNSLIDKINK